MNQKYFISYETGRFQDLDLEGKFSRVVNYVVDVHPLIWVMEQNHEYPSCYHHLLFYDKITDELYEQFSHTFK